MGDTTLAAANDDDSIDPDAPKDVKVRVKEYCQVLINGKSESQSRMAEFECSKANLIKSAEYFAAHWRFDRNKDHIFFDRCSLLSMEVWLGVFHGEIPKRLLAILPHELWHIIDAGERYGFTLSPLLKEFFAEWYTKNVNELDTNIARELALPCFVFDHAEGFMRMTKYLIYEFPGHITEKKPVKIKYQHIHLAPPEFVGPMNHARGRLKTIFHSRLWTPARKLHTDRQECLCRKATEFDYLDTLITRKVFPIDDYTGRTSLNELLSRLDGFSHIPAARNCKDCNIDWVNVVEGAVETIEGYSQGLCLDCMNRSRISDDDADYWRKCGANLSGRWDSECRMTHGEPTWYVSWIGRSEHRQKLLDEKKARKNGFG